MVVAARATCSARMVSFAILIYIDLSSFVAFRPASRVSTFVVGLDGHQESCRLVRHQLQDRIQVLIGPVACGLALQQPPTRSAQQQGCQQRCTRGLQGSIPLDPFMPYHRTGYDRREMEIPQGARPDLSTR